MNEYMDVEQLKDYLMVSKGLIYKLVKTNQIPHRRIGSRIIFKKTEVNNWLDRSEH
ncbi:helix-turn-helix domain-containing protein [Alkalibacillus haloalkaliphilus]|uniref:helix-turn-helix domain-containing protein n=1 Tax=Alkalibacillus haloalkaliphilus TaxID=94136 RepID=UPI0002E267FE|nr:helix-turn-helix domain-containing protein [Alkalibacillus haloalkaliphilus]